MVCSKEFLKWLLCLMVVGLTACAGSSSDSPSIPPNNQNSSDKPDTTETVKGSINGRDWTYLQGRASPFRRNNKKYIEIRLWNREYDSPCTEPIGSTYQVRLYAEFSEGSWKIDPLDPFSLIPTIIFSDYTTGTSSRNNLIADVGTISIRSLTANRVSGVVQGQFSNAQNVGKTQVFGRFDVSLCTPLFGSD